MTILPLEQPSYPPRPKSRDLPQLGSSIKFAGAIFGLYADRFGHGFTAQWRFGPGEPLQRAHRAHRADAETILREKMQSLRRGVADWDQLTHSDRQELILIRKNILNCGLSLDESTLIVRAASKHLLRGIPITKQAQDLDTLYPENPVLTIPQLADQLIQRTHQNGASPSWSRNLAQQLNIITARFDCPPAKLFARDVDAWLRELPVGPRSRKNYLGTLNQVIQLAKKLGQLSTDWNELAHVEIPKHRPAPINLYTPKQIRDLLETAQAHQPEMVPFLALNAFVPIRHAELTRLTWSDIRLSDPSDPSDSPGSIRIAAAIAKTSQHRALEIPKNLAAWLMPYAQTDGPICTLKNTSHALCRLRKKAGIPLGETGKDKHNALRKTCITYRVALNPDLARIAYEAGNSPAMIHAHYHAPALNQKRQAQAWFEVTPRLAVVPRPRSRPNNRAHHQLTLNLAEPAYTLSQPIPNPPPAPASA